MPTRGRKFAFISSNAYRLSSIFPTFDSFEGTLKGSPKTWQRNVIFGNFFFSPPRQRQESAFELEGNRLIRNVSRDVTRISSENGGRGIDNRSRERRFLDVIIQTESELGTFILPSWCSHRRVIPACNFILPTLPPTRNG